MFSPSKQVRHLYSLINVPVAFKVKVYFHFTLRNTLSFYMNLILLSIASINIVSGLQAGAPPMPPLSTGTY
jgi:hypothetical protein